MPNSGIKIGRLFGINIYIDWSWVFIFLLVVVNLAVGVFPSLHPDWSAALIWGTAIAAAILFFASVLAHELAHSVVAKANGLPVNSIVLFLFGGVSNIAHEPSSAGTEFLIALVGPLTSVVLGVFFMVLASIGLATTPGANALGDLSRAGPVTTLFLWLGPVNILVGIFNLIPGFPLDGGRVLRAILWGASHNLRRATRWATMIGQAIAWLFILIGIALIFGFQIPFFGTGLVDGLWIALIGWFLNQAAVASYRQVAIEDLLDGVPVSQLMQHEVPTVSSEVSVRSLVYDDIMPTNERAYAVVEGDHLLGLVTLEDVRKVPQDRWDTTTVSEIMTPADHLTIATPREDTAQALNDLASQEIRQVPVVQEGHLVGILRRQDIMRWLSLRSQLAAR